MQDMKSIAEDMKAVAGMLEGASPSMLIEKILSDRYGSDRFGSGERNRMQKPAKLRRGGTAYGTVSPIPLLRQGASSQPAQFYSPGAISVFRSTRSATCGPCPMKKISPAAVDAIAKEHRAEVERKIADLNSLKAELDRMIDRCGCGVVADCRIIESLSPQA